MMAALMSNAATYKCEASRTTHDIPLGMKMGEELKLTFGCVSYLPLQPIKIAVGGGSNGAVAKQLSLDKNSTIMLD